MVVLFNLAISEGDHFNDEDCIAFSKTFIGVNLDISPSRTTALSGNQFPYDLYEGA